MRASPTCRTSTRSLQARTWSSTPLWSGRPRRRAGASSASSTSTTSITGCRELKRERADAALLALLALALFAWLAPRAGLHLDDYGFWSDFSGSGPAKLLRLTRDYVPGRNLYI